MATAFKPSKSVRALGAGSQLLEDSYAAFVSRVIEEGIKTISKHENKNERYVLLAGVRRIRCSKRTGLLSCEQLATVKGVEKWRPAKNPGLSHFWHSNKELTACLESAWAFHLDKFIPSQDECYPDKRREDTHRRNLMVFRAAERRTGGQKRQTLGIKMLTSALWSYLTDRELLKLAHAYFGRKASFDDYNFVVKNEAFLRARAAETPNLVRFIGAYIRINKDLKTGVRELPMNILAEARKELFNLERSVQLHRYFITGPSAHPFYLQEISPVGWRYLTTLTGAVISRIWSVSMWDWTAREDEGQSPGPTIAASINYMAKTGVVAPLSFLKWVTSTLPMWCVQNYSDEGLNEIRESGIRLLRLAAQQSLLAKKKGTLKRFIRGDLNLVWDWFSNQGGDNYRRGPFDDDVQPEAVRQPLSIAKNATWASLMRAQHEWHNQRAERERIRREADARAHQEWLARQDSISWESALDEFEHLGVKVRPLTTGLALRTEGNEMNHCVGSYTTHCQSGRSRIFALEEGGNRATVELVKTAKSSWRINQVFGPKNTPATASLEATAKQLVKLYQAASNVLLAKAA